MYFANPWGLLALLALPAIAAIHLYHRRFPPLVIAGAHLWGMETELRSAGRRLDRLPVTATLLLELLAALLLALVLSQPRIGDMGTAAHLVVVLDNSASMASEPAGGAPFRERVVAELDERMRSFERGSVITVLLTGRRPVMLAGPAVPWDEARPLLEAWWPSAPQHEFAPAWDRAAQFAEDGGELLFVTDRLPDEETALPQGMEVVSVGQSLDNIAITAARWSFDSAAGRGTIFLRVENLGRAPADITVTGTASGGPVFMQTVSLPTGEGVPLEARVPGGLGEIEITATGASLDPLAVDSTVTLVEPKVRIVTVANTFGAGDLVGGLTRRVLRELPDIQDGEAGSAHLLIAPAETLPPSRSDLWWLGIGPIDPSEAARDAALDLAGPFLIEKQHPLVAGITLGGVVWGGAQDVPLQLTPIVSAGRHTLLGRLAGTRTTAYLMNIDFGRSNLADTPDWPILLSNLVEQRRDALPGLRRWNYRLKEEIRFRLFEETAAPAADAGELRLVRDGEERAVARTAVVELPPLEEAGVYEVRDGEALVGRFAVNFFDPDESRLTELRPGRRAAEVAVDAGTFRLDNPFSWLMQLGLAAILVAVLLDWRVLRASR